MTETCPLESVKLLQHLGEALVGRWEQKPGCSGLRSEWQEKQGGRDSTGHFLQKFLSWG